MLSPDTHGLSEEESSRIQLTFAPYLESLQPSRVRVCWPHLCIVLFAKTHKATFNKNCRQRQFTCTVLVLEKYPFVPPVVQLESPALSSSLLDRICAAASKEITPIQGKAGQVRPSSFFSSSSVHPSRQVYVVLERVCKASTNLLLAAWEEVTQAKRRLAAHKLSVNPSAGALFLSLQQEARSLSFSTLERYLTWTPSRSFTLRRRFASLSITPQWVRILL